MRRFNAMPRSNSPTSLALANLRGVVILIVLAFHAMLAYLNWIPVTGSGFDTPPYDWRAFPIIDSHRFFGFDLICAWQDVYLMSLMFFLSGLFVWPSLVRKKECGILARPRPTAWPALRFRHRHCHPGGRLSRLPIDRGRSGHRGLLARPARAAVLAEWAVVVSLAALGAELYRRRTALCRARRDTGARPLVGRSR